MDLARLLWDARRLGHTIDAADCDLPKTSEQAYAVQEAIATLSGLNRVGYKVGSTSKEAQRLLGTDEPGAGVLLESYLHESPCQVAINAQQVPSVEGEFAFRMARDLVPQGPQYTMSDITNAIESVAGAIEIVGTRFSGGLSGKGRLLTTADGGVNIALVTGKWMRFREQDLRHHEVKMTINGIEKETGTGSRALGDPLNVVLWLANHLSSRGLGLKSGEVISTGTCTGLSPVSCGDVVRADFGVFGAVSVQFH